jgi:hypothetical protein
VSGGQSSTQGDDGTRPGSDAPVNGDDDTGGDEAKFDFVSAGETIDGCSRVVDVEPLPSAIEVIVDVSQTMATQYVDHDGLPETPSITRWRLLANALAEWMPVLSEGADLDLQTFPSADSPAPPSSSACESWIGPGLGTPADELLAELPPPEATFMSGANPTDRAIANAQSMLQGVDPDAKRTIVLFTDGAPNCSELSQPPELFDEVNDATRGWAEYAWAAGMPTWVVAIAVPEGEYGGSQGDPVANHLQVLNNIANAGGTPLLLAPNAAELDFALEWIVSQTRSCRASIPAEFSGSGFLVEVDGQTFYDVGGNLCYDADGFVYVDNGRLDTVELCGTACELFVAQGVATFLEQCSFPE